ncbi:putative disease resistance protein At1g50180 [Salvia miltiorrhiza]|uniref:putative disease resistance protein At1g50180 n=1 Tax=Salvia miltiorrhiza TaxID=226208 RepID=UPI0025ABBD4C|nr:putative disease resistance protein At1g50180 [Salvia miltiorrhiza]XP_057781292.1 putative disease resistance protein At1g50180 [Salvia miltiorrhiza]XP_057781293.1 putative disease resistance protein At1g50180 [Salvia miltiorrhiza]XP_057781294.1 putative disease resistance protein At1g50180 [Salvia miltiorrhiza]XP_057781295.1 putative disease resistance protein At1g50180 [Salvia miltiorrhiza]
MAEAVVSTALETLRDLLVEEARFFYGVGDQVRELEIQLKEIKCLLEDADRRRHKSKTILSWISEIKDLVYGAEAAIERHAAYQVLARRRRGIRQLIKSIHQLGSEISPIKSRLERINKEMLESGIKKSIINNTDEGESSSANNRARKSFPEFEIGECFVGMKDELKQLLHLLVEDEKHRVISVWGMGGSGKTTIAKKLYNETRTSFDLCAWVCISQQCQSFQSVWNDVLMQLQHQNTKDGPKIRGDVTSLSEWELKERLCKIQREKRCLIVFDDLWETTHWDDFKHPFLVQDLQSKILITTREREVAEIGCPVKLGFLKEEDALELLKKKAFPHTIIPEFALEENFEKIGKEMVQKCGYLPLAISLLGGVLRKKNSMMEWELVKEIIYRDEKEIDGVLNLSYESLPYYLKPCFLYMGIFQEDETINPKDLFRMWIAQGMISYENIGDKDKTLIEIAKLYLGELASRSIVQVEIDDAVTRDIIYRSCKLHDVVRELCLKLGRSEDFGVQCLEYQSGKLQQASSHRKIRHLTIHLRKEVQVEHDELTVTWGEDSSEHLRSLQIFNHINSGVVEFPPQSIIDFQKFKLLRDLVVVGFKFTGRKLPKGITNFVHLRRLYLKRCEFDKLPSSIRNLVYMDTLDLTDSMNVEVPNVFKEMVRLKHLFLPEYEEENIGSYRLTLDEGVVELESLVGLDSRVHELKCMNRMKNLRYFSTSIHDNESLSAIMNAIATNWNKLVYCRVEIKEGCELGTNEGVLNKAFTCPNLHSLWIVVKLGKTLAECGRDFISSKLRNLVLSECEIEDDPMGILGKLPCLRDLYLLRKSFVGEKMTCPSNSFPRLKRLHLLQLPNLREWRVEAGAMPILSELQIDECSSLKMLPEGLSGISTLRELHIYGELGKRVSASGEDFHKVCHVPSIIIRNY